MFWFGNCNLLPLPVDFDRGKSAYSESTQKIDKGYGAQTWVKAMSIIEKKGGKGCKV